MVGNIHILVVMSLHVYVLHIYIYIYIYILIIVCVCGVCVRGGGEVRRRNALQFFGRRPYVTRTRSL